MMERKKSKFIRMMAILAVIILCMPNMIVHASESGKSEYSSDINQNDGTIIVIRDSNGAIVETHEMGRQIFVNGTQYTIPAGGTLTTYQYWASVNFSAGFYFVHSSYSGYATTRDRSVTITIRKSPSVGGTRTVVASKTYSTNEESNIYDSGYSSGIQAGCSDVALSVTPGDSDRYYDAVYKNNSSNSMTISLMVARD